MPTTVVLVHGAFADSASFAPVTRLLLDEGLDVRVPPVANRSLLGDAAALRRFVEQVGGQVLLVGHSYGGAVITQAGDADAVVGLVYLAGYALVEGESLGQLQGGFPDSDLAANLVYQQYPLPDGTEGTDVSVRVDAFPEVFAAGVDPATAQVLAVGQRPLSALAFGEAATVAAWRTKPGWGLVSAADRTINPDVERFGYQRAGLEVVEVAGAPHLVMHQNPQAVVDLIRTALAAVGG
ncbi:alpha/beta fold hydrolase [Cellulomonas marina]|uniref:Pimeloyl-ACP methyl ester carboxylesterase n=1 Tax=Cellulomonas marina TaxID=988821 RepID=A0A1I0Z7X8_9CELL|nr:alpha/beta hydrolase [Cellulomonas marina]GIG29043.1 alpha/beta hydrolase [Cellulomonas marina]SFB21724.1 Pimeloyl-ACP methyl ester carboxylesterase [Cellulomonas marina]